MPRQTLLAWALGLWLGASPLPGGRCSEAGRPFVYRYPAHSVTILELYKQ